MTSDRIKAPWRQVQLGEVLNRMSRFEATEPTTEYRFAGTYSFGRGIFVGERKIGSTFALPKVQRIRTDDFVYCKIMAWEGAFGTVPPEADGCVLSGAFVVYEVNREQLEPRFLRWMFTLPSFWQEVGRQSTGTNVRRRSLHPEQLEATTVAIPSIEEQRRIVGRIEHLASLVSELVALRKAAQSETESLMAQVAAAEYDRAQEAYGTRCLNDICYQITDGTHSTPIYRDEGVPFLSVKDITSGRISFDSVRYVSPEDHADLTKRCKPERGDVLLTKIGTTGFAKAIDTDREFSIFVSLALLKLKRESVSPEYVQHMLNSSRLRDRSSAGTRGVGNQNLVLKFIRDFPLPVPPLEEQRQIVARLNTVQGSVTPLERLQAESASEIKALLPSILDRAFKGEL